MLPESITHLILDMDGVLCHGATPVPRLAEFFERLRTRHVGFVLATNNSTRTSEMYVEKFAHWGIKLDAGQILTSGEATAGWLRTNDPDLEEVYVVGARGLRAALEARGFTLLHPEDVRGGRRARVVVCGFDPEVCYEQLAMASLLVREGAAFIATNPDPSLPTEHGLLPGNGSLLAVIITATGVHPRVIGKPEPTLFEQALRRLNVSPERCAMVGDRLSTDIKGGRAAGLFTALVLSGATGREELEDSVVQPDAVFDDIHALLPS